MPNPPLSLDDIFASDSTPPKKRQQPAGGPIDLDELLGGDEPLRLDPVVVSEPRRGIANAISESLGSIRDPFNLGARTEALGNRLFPSLRPETRTLVPPTDRRTPAQRTQDERAAAAQQYGRVPAEATATPTQTFVRAPTAAGPGTGVPVEQNVAENAETQQKLAERSTLTGRFSPEKWREIAVKGMDYANSLHALGRHDEAQDVARKAYNAQLLSEGAAQADTHGAIVLSNLLGIIHDPFAAQRRNIAEARQPGMVATPDEQQEMGIAQPAAAERGFDVGKDIVAPLVGQGPAIIAGGAVGRTLAAAGAGVAERYGARGIGEALGKLATGTEVPELMGPRVPVTSGRNLALRIGEEAQEFRQALPSMMKRGATEGQLVMGAQQYREARQQGASVEDAVAAALQGAELNVPFGAAAEIGLGLVGRAAGVGFDPIGHIAAQIRDRVRGSEVVGPEALDAADAARAADGQLPISDQTPEAAHRKIADALEQVLGQKRTAQDAESARLAARMRDAETAFNDQPPPAGPDWWEQNAPPPEEPLVQPVEGYRARAPEENPPLRSAAEIAMERTRPTDEANALVRMQRAEEFTRAARMEAEQAAQEPDLRLEQAAQQRPGEVQGPRTLGETLADAQEQRAAGEPLASDYHDAINKYVDALAQVRDLPEDQAPTMRQQVTLARAKAALNEARQRYGRQLGASAVLALAMNDDELSDEEKKFGGLAAVGLLGVPEGERGPVEPVSAGFTSRLRSAIETLPGKRWDSPVPAADWIGKLKGLGTFSKAELKMLLPDLEQAQASKTKLDRAAVLEIAERNLPQISRETLQNPDVPSTRPALDTQFGDGDPTDITDIDEVNTDDHDEVVQQMANRQARINHVESEIEERQREAESEMEYRSEEADRAAEGIRHDLESAGLDRNLADAAIDYINDHLEGDYLPRGALDKAMEKIYDDLYSAAGEGRLDEDQLREELENRGYTIEEEPKMQRKVAAVVPPEHENHFLVTGRPRTERGETVWNVGGGASSGDSVAEIEQRNRAALEEQFGPEVARSARFFEEPHESGRTEYVIRDSEGKEVARAQYDVENAMRKVADSIGLEHGGDEPDMDSLVRDIKSGLANYADARIAWGEAEGTHYYYTENEEDAFSQEHEEMDRLRDEISTLDGHRQALADAAAAVPPAQPENAAPEQPANPHLMPILPPVKGSVRFSTYQRIGGGTNYRELLNSWMNRPEGPIPESAYGGHDYWSAAGASSVVGHVRAEDHVVYNMPDVVSREIKINADDPPEVVRIKNKMAENRAKRDKGLARLQELSDEYGRLPESERESSRAHEIAREYQSVTNDVTNQSKREDELLTELRDYLGKDAPPPRRVAVMIENQASLAQHQQHLGPPPDPATLAPLKAAWDEAESARIKADNALDRADTARDDAMAAWNKAWEDHLRRFDDTTPDAAKYGTNYYGEPATAREAMRAQALTATGQPTWGDIEPLTSRINNDLDYYGEPASAGRKLWDYWAQQSPELAQAIGQLRAAQVARDEAAEATYTARRVRDAARDAYEDVAGSSSDLRVDTPFNDTQAAIQLNAARFLIDSAERGYDRIAWSDAANRVVNAHMAMPAAKYVMDQATPAAMKRLLGYLGFKDVNIEKLWIKGNGHWSIELTPDMRAAIRKVGLPILGLMALVGTPSEAKAEDTASDSSSRSLYSGAVGGLVAGAALAALMASKKLRRLVKENRELNRALMIDDLSGLANKRAFSLARTPIDNDPNTSWVALDASQFKKVNDTAGHDAGDQAIAHFGRSIAAAAKAADVPMRGFRVGGDEFAFAVPKGREAEFLDSVERLSRRDFGGATTQLHGAAGDSYAEADARLIQRKEDLRALNPEMRRSTDRPPESGEEAETIAKAIAEAQLPKDLPQGVTLHANPIGPAMRQLARYPAAASLIGLGALLGESDNDNVRRAGVPTMVLGALSVIGSHRLAMAGEALGDGVVKLLGQTDAGRRAISYINPDVLLSTDAKKALRQYEQTKAYGRSVALEHSRASQRLGPQGDRAVSDVIENEGWEDTSGFTQQQLSDVLTVAAGIEAETRKLTQAKIASGVLRSEQALPNYLKREYAYFDVLDALAEHQGSGGTRAGKTIGEATKSRVLDEPIRAAEAAVAEAQQSGDAQKIKAAEDALTEAQLVQQQNRTTLGEIREASYRVGKTFDQGWHDVAAAKLHEQLRNIPGTVHPDYARALDDFLAARDLAKQATTTADRNAAKALMDRSYIEMREIGDRFKQKGGEYRTLPDTRSYGVLRGMPVQRAIYAEIAPQFDPSAWDDFLNFWKQSKTIFNPGTSIANVASNVMFSHMEGLPLYQQPKYLRAAIKDMRAYGPATRHLSETGVLEASATFSPNEIRNPAAARSEEGLSDLFATTRPETRKVMEERGLTGERIARNKKVSAIGRTVAGAAVGTALMADEENPEDAGVGAVLGGLAGFALNPKVRGFVRRGYANEDNLFRVALYLKKLDDGIPPRYAAQYAKDALGDMSAPQAPITQTIRRVASPFFLYPLRAVPRFAQQAIDHPWRYVALMGAMAAVDLYSRSQVGEVPERDLAPADRRDMFGYFLPGFTQLPMMDEQGNKGAVDMARWTPLSAMTSSAPAGATGGALSDEFPAFLQPSGPLLDLGGRLASNVDPFSGKPLIKKDYPIGENIANVLNQAGEMAAPSFLAFHRRRLEEDVRNRDWEKFKNDVLGPTGMRPRFVRPGGEVRQATFQLQEDLNAMKHEFNQAMIANKNPDHARDIVDQYKRRVTSALAHFSERIGPPPKALVDDALDTTVRR